MDTHGLTKRIVTDNGPQFLDTWTQLWDPHGTSCHHTAVGNPKGNGLVERLNRTVTQILMASTFFRTLVTANGLFWLPTHKKRSIGPLTLAPYRLHMS